MHSERNRLLLLLVLVAVVTALASSPAFARRAKTQVGPVPEWTSAGKQPGVGTTSGEPDVGQGPKYQKTGTCLPVPPQGRRQDLGAPWFRWILRIWMSSFMGAR